MKIIPQDGLLKLEIDKIIQHTQSKCLGQGGVDYIEQLTPQKDHVIIQRQLLEVEEYLNCIGEDAVIPLTEYASIQPILRYLKVPDYVLDSAQCWSISSCILLIAELKAFFLEKESRAERYPNLFEHIQKEEVFHNLVEEIKRILTPQGDVKPTASPELMRIIRLEGGKRKELEAKFGDLAKKYGDKNMLSDSVESIRNGRRVLSVLAENKRLVKGILHDDSATGKTVYIEPEELVDLNNSMMELRQDKQREVFRIMEALSNQMRPHIDAFYSYEETLIFFDVVRAKAFVAREMKAVRPTLLDRPNIAYKEAYHPYLLLTSGLNRKEVVPFDMEFRANNHMLLISGPNAGGKSICMKAVGLLQVMLQMGFLLPVDEGSICGVFEQCFVDIGDRQSIEDELSTYSSRLVLAKEFVSKADEKTMVLIDEFGAGTDPKMGGAIAESILAELIKRKAFGVLNTHYSNLKNYATKTKGIINGAMIFDKDTLSPTYQLRIGKPGSSFAFEIAQKSGLPQAIIQRAQSKIGKDTLVTDRLLNQLERERQKLEQAQSDLQEKQRQLDHLIKNYEESFKRLDFERKKFKLQRKEQLLADEEHAKRDMKKALRVLKEEANKEKAMQDLQSMIEDTQQEQKKIAQKIGELKEDIHEFHQPVSLDELQANDTVRLRLGGQLAKVIKVHRSDVEIALGQFSMRVGINELEIIKNPIKKQPTSFVKKDMMKRYSNFESKLDIRGMKLDIAHETLQRFFDEAMLANASDVTIIHGKGSGVLRTLVKKTVKEYRAFESLSHPPNDQGGDGVSIIRFA